MARRARLGRIRRHGWRGRVRGVGSTLTAAPGTRRRMSADSGAWRRAMSAAFDPNERHKKNSPARSRRFRLKTLTVGFTSDTRSTLGRSGKRTVCKPASVHTRPEAARSNRVDSTAGNKACIAGRNNTVSPPLPRRQEHRSKRSKNHAPTQRVRLRGPLPAYRQGLMQEEFVGTYVSPFPLIVDKRPSGRFRCFFGPGLTYEPKTPHGSRALTDDGHVAFCYNRGPALSSIPVPSYQIEAS
jgi:hypothetical protein